MKITLALLLGATQLITTTALSFNLLLENPGIPLPFRIQTNSLKVLDLKFKVLDEII
jgi:hypothetical protein